MSSNTGAVARFLRPRSVAIAGMSARPGSAGQTLLQCLKVNAFGGPIHLVGRGAEPIDGRPVLAGIDDLPEGVDLAVLSLPAAAVRDAVAACARRQVGAVLVFAAGFAEVGDVAAQEEVARIAREAGMALVGPNCLGYTNHVDGLCLHLIVPFKARRDGTASRPGVALVGQSGGLLAHLEWAIEARGLPLTYMITTGNEAGLDLTDFLEFLVEDAATRVIVLYGEQIRRPGAFLAAARRARGAGKPVVLLHPGQGVRARQAAQSHTGALVGDHGAMRASVERAGVLVVDALDALIDVCELLARHPKPSARGPAIFTASGAYVAIANDFCETLGLVLPPLSPATDAAAKALLPAFGNAGNPLDATAGAPPEVLTGCTRALLEDPNIGSLLAAFPLPGKMGARRLEALGEGAAGATKPVVVAALGDYHAHAPEVLAAAKQASFIFSRSPDRSLRALALYCAYGKRLAEPHDGAMPLPFEDLPALGKGPQPEWLGKTLLAAAGIRVPEGALARNLEEAAAIAKRIGYPVVLKAQASALTHKTEAGGVMLDLAGEAALGRAWKTLNDNIARAVPGMTLDGVLVERMSPKGVELMIGAKRDPAWGPVLLVGLGGIWVEALGDVKLLAPDAGHDAILASLKGLRSAKLLSGFRGAAPSDLDAVARAVAAVGRLMRTVPQIVEIDVNPLAVHACGEGVTALDALVVTG